MRPAPSKKSGSADPLTPLTHTAASHMPLEHENGLLTWPSRATYSAVVMKAELGSRFRIAGLVRSPDREGALAHLDPDRGFAFVARGSTNPNDVIDPAIWVKEKISLALGIEDSADTPLGRVIGAIRALHGELMGRSETERPWVSVLVLLLLGEDAVAISAGDCPCFRFRSGLLSQLGRSEPDSIPRPPRGALGTESQVRIEVVPLRPQPGDLYVLSTRALRDGELAVLARDLTSAKDSPQLLRAGVDGASDRGRLAVRILEGMETEDIATLADAPMDQGPLMVDRLTEEEPRGTPPDGASTAESLGTTELRIEELRPNELEEVPKVEFEPVPVAAVEAPPEREPIAPRASELQEATLVEEPPNAGEDDRTADVGRTEPPEIAPGATESQPRRPDLARPETLAPVEEDRPWYEPFALWAGGALAIVALALLIRSLLAGFSGTSTPPTNKGVPVAVTGLADVFSDPPGATVRVDGVALSGKTPLVGVSLATGPHRVDLDWGTYGVWRDTVEVTADARLTIHPALHGIVSFRSSEPDRVLDVYLDGIYAGTTPLTLDTVVVGRHLVRFGGAETAASAREIEVLRDQQADIVGDAGPLPATGALTVRTSILGDTGFEASKGDPFWVDGAMRGVTPATVALKPGTHSVRVARRGFPPKITVLEIKAGTEQFVTAEFGASSDEPLQYNPPDAFSISNPTPLTVSLPAREWEPTMSLWLYAAPPGGSFQARRMTRIEDESRTFAALLPPEILGNRGRQVRFYFKAIGAAGRELYSEIYTVPLRD